MDAPQSNSWLILTTRDGRDIRDPSSTDRAAALRELFHEDADSLSEAFRAEHPNAWLRFGFDDGPMYVLDVYRNGRLLFGQWADQDYESELAPETAVERISEEAALQLWTWLAEGDVSKIKAHIEAQQ